MQGAHNSDFPFPSLLSVLTCVVFHLPPVVLVALNDPRHIGHSAPHLVWKKWNFSEGVDFRVLCTKGCISPSFGGSNLDHDPHVTVFRDKAFPALN